MGVRVKGEGEEEAGKEGGSWNECKKYPSLPFFFLFSFWCSAWRMFRKRYPFLFVLLFFRGIV